MACSSLCSPLSSAFSSARSSLRSACSVSACEWTDTYSPAAIDMDPATRPATPATTTPRWFACAAATPSTRLEVERMPSFAPSTAARSQPIRFVRCRSSLPTGMLEAFLIGAPPEAAKHARIRERRGPASPSIKDRAIRAHIVGVSTYGNVESRISDQDSGDLGEFLTCTRSEEHTSELQSLRHLVCRL